MSQLQPPRGPVQCAPSNTLHECEFCGRFNPGIPSDPDLRNIMVVDASRFLIRGSCPIFLSNRTQYVPAYLKDGVVHDD